MADWHDAPLRLPLHEFLGWTWSEYADWVADRSRIPARPLPSPKPEADQ